MQMSNSDQIDPAIRRLRATDEAKVVAYFLRLDDETRRMRFGGQVNDQFVKDYAENLLSGAFVAFGAFPDGELRGVAELRWLIASWPLSAEVALLVEPQWQDAGIGDALFSRLIAAAQNRGIHRLHMLCLRENLPMRNLAKKRRAVLEIKSGDVAATLLPPWPTPVSIFEEIFGDPGRYLLTTFYLDN